MAKIRTNPGEKWARVTPQRVDDYLTGVKNPRASWQQQTVNAEKNYESGITTAITQKRFSKGVQKAGDTKWQTNAVTKGGARFGPGVQAGQSAYEAGFSPYAQVIESTTLPPRYAKGDPRNLDRVKAMAQALRAKKVSG